MHMYIALFNTYLYWLSSNLLLDNFLFVLPFLYTN